MRNNNPYYDEENPVLKNKLGITDPKLLREVEYGIATLADAQLRVTPIQGKFDFQHLAAIHKALFEPVYEWAGEKREINFSKVVETRPGWKCVFARVEDIEARMDAVGAAIARANNLNGLSQRDFSHAMSNIYNELNYIHPFPEGNGRSTKAFMRQLSNQVGYDLNFERVSPKEWNTAAADGQVLTNIREPSLTAPSHPGPMVRVFERIVEPLMQQLQNDDTRQRLLVMNGQCVTQSFDATNNKWNDGKVEKAAGRPPGFYNLYSATGADTSKATDGLIVHTDSRSVFQQVGKSLVKHPAENFDKVPEIGTAKTISYADGRAVVGPSLGRGRSRGI